MPAYTQRAELVFQLAKDAARRRKHLEVYPVHILFALFQEGSGLAVQILKNRGFSVARVEEAMWRYCLKIDAVLPEDLPWTDPARFVSQSASAETQALGHNYVGTEHILLAMTKIQAHQWLGLAFAKDLDDIRQEVLNLLGHGEEKSKKRPTYGEILEKVFAMRDIVEQLAKDLQ